jgi:uncharacterized protein YjbI with pentapeptide repeats
MAAPDSLSARWQTNDGATLLDEALARLISGQTLTGLGLDEHEGRIDLRNAPAPIPRRLARFATERWFVEQLGELIQFRDVAIVGIDFSGAMLPHFRFHGTRIEDCRFDSAACLDWRLWASTVVECDFSRTSLRQSALGNWHAQRGNAWQRVDFTRADVRGAVLTSSLFEDCKFDRTKLDGVSFDQCALRRCRFQGTLRRVTFDGRPLPDRAPPQPLQDVDFSDARFEDVEFRGLRIDHVTLPDDPDLYVVRNFRDVSLRALTLLGDGADVGSRMLRAEIENSLKMMRTTHEDAVLNRRDYVRSGGDELADQAFELYRAAALPPSA